MAITDNFDLNLALTNGANAYKCWVNYNYGGNTMGISDADYQKIQSNWSKELHNWKTHYDTNHDDNYYDIEDIDDANANYAAGKNQAAENTEFDGEADGGGTAAVVTTSVLGGGMAGCGAAFFAIFAAVTKGLDGGLKAAKTKIAACVAAAGIIMLTIASLIFGLKPNKSAAEACDVMKDSELPAAQESLEQNQAQMEADAAEMEDLTGEAEDINEATNEEIAKAMEEFLQKQEVYLALKEKQEAGEELTSSEKELLKSLGEELEGMDITGLIESLQADASDDTADIMDEIEGYQESFDEVTDNMEAVKGVTDFAAGFDEETASNASLMKGAAIAGEIGSAGVMAAGAFTMAKGFAKGLFGIWEVILSGIAIATAGVAAGLFGQSISDQNSYQNQAEAEIEVREATEELNVETAEVYTERLDVYDGTQDYISEDLELIDPEIEDDGSGETPTVTVDGLDIDKKDEEPETIF